MKVQILPLALCSTLFFGVSTFAAEAPNADTNSAEQITIPEPNTSDRTLAFVKIDGVSFDGTDKTQGYLDTTDMEGNKIRYHVKTDTLILDEQTGSATFFSALDGIDRAYIFHTNLIPEGQTIYAEAIVINLPMDVGCPMLHTVEAVHDNGKIIQITTDNGSLHLFVKKDTPTSLFGSSEPQTTEDIHVGSRVFAWYTGVLESYPAQAFPSTLSLIPEASATVSLVLNGKATDLVGIPIDGVVYVPLRATAAALDCQVAWDKETRTTKLSSPSRAMNLTLGEDLYVSYSANPNLIGMTAPQKLGGAPFVSTEGVLYVPGETFHVLVGFDVTLSESTLTIEKNKSH